MDKICEKFVTMNPVIKRTMEKVDSVFTYCVRNLTDVEPYYSPTQDYSEGITQALLGLIDTCVSYVDKVAIPKDMPLEMAYARLLYGALKLPATNREAVGVGCMLCTIHAAKRGSILLVPPHFVSTCRKDTNAQTLARQLVSVTFTYRQFIGFNNELDPVFGLPFSVDGLIKGIRASVYLYGKKTDYGYGITRLGGAVRLSEKTGTLTFETPHYKMRLTLKGLRYQHSLPTHMILLWWLSVVPLVCEFATTDNATLKNAAVLSQSARTATSPMGIDICRTGSREYVVVKDTVWCSQSGAVVRVNNTAMEFCIPNVEGVRYNDQRDITKLRYIANTSVANAISSVICDTALSGKEVVAKYFKGDMCYAE